MRHGIAEGLHLLVNRSELGSPFFDLGFDFRVNRVQFDLTFADQEHFASALSDVDYQEGDLKSNPPRMLDGPPWTRVKDPIDRLGQ